ncbi:MAG TPA: hypothetical protein VMA31_19200 [Bryobacteraceae bacterium]|nr:hypothetical protein [Bryobacteraceae bacterium]
MRTLALLTAAATLTALAPPVSARVESYGPRRYTQVGRAAPPRGAGRPVVIDRHHGPGWGGVAAAGLFGLAAGLALGGTTPAPPPAYYAPPAVGTVVPMLPAGCATIPTYNGAVVYNCGGIYYQPFYQGMSLMYQIVPAP